MPPPTIRHLVVLMMENRSFDHMFGFADPDDDEIDDLGGAESNAAPGGGRIVVHTGAKVRGVVDLGHKLRDVNEQLFETPDPQPGAVPTMGGFVKNYAKQPGVKPKDVGQAMKCFAPEDLPVLTTLAREFALCDAWFSSVPGPTLPNRAFAHCASSNGAVDNNPLAFARLTTIYERLADHGVTSKVYSFDGNSLATSLPFMLKAGNTFLGSFEEFMKAAKKGELPQYSFVEPRYNNYFDHARQRAYFASDQHPPNDVGHGENLIADIYEALRKSPRWEDTLFVITYDEHGGFYDHVPPPAGVPPWQNGQPKPDQLTDFDFSRLGVRVPTVFISPYIEPGTVVKARPGVVFDHCSLGATARELFAPAALPLNDRDEVARTFADVLTRSTARPDADTPKKLDRKKVKASRRQPQNVGGGALSDHQSSQVLAAARLDELLPADKRVLGTTPEFRTIQDIWTEQRAQDYIRLVSKRARKYWGQS